MFPRKIFERKEVVARDDEENVMTAEAARVLVKGEQIHVERDCAVELYLERNGERNLRRGHKSSPRYSIFLNLGDGF